MTTCAGPGCFSKATTDEYCGSCDVALFGGPPFVDEPLQCPERECANCKRPFQPTIVRRRLCVPCFHGTVGANYAMRG